MLVANIHVLLKTFQVGRECDAQTEFNIKQKVIM